MRKALKKLFYVNKESSAYCKQNNSDKDGIITDTQMPNNRQTSNGRFNSAIVKNWFLFNQYAIVPIQLNKCASDTNATGTHYTELFTLKSK
jgi:hypothetical protein